MSNDDFCVRLHFIFEFYLNSTIVRCLPTLLQTPRDHPTFNSFLLASYYARCKRNSNWKLVFSTCDNWSVKLKIANDSPQTQWLKTWNRQFFGIKLISYSHWIKVSSRCKLGYSFPWIQTHNISLPKYISTTLRKINFQCAVIRVCKYHLQHTFDPANMIIESDVIRRLEIAWAN